MHPGTVPSKRLGMPLIKHDESVTYILELQAEAVLLTSSLLTDLPG